MNRKILWTISGGKTLTEAAKGSFISPKITMFMKDLPDLEQHLGSHAEKAVHNAEREYHRHAIDISAHLYVSPCQKGSLITHSQAQEPRQGSYGELNVDFLQVIMDHWKCPLDEGLEYPLVQKSTVHGRSKFHKSACMALTKYRPQTHSSLVVDGRKGPQEAKKLVLPTCICEAIRSGPSQGNSSFT